MKEGPKPPWNFLLNELFLWVAGLASLLACLWVLRSLRLLHQESRERLLPRQIMHLAIADILLVAHLLIMNTFNQVASTTQFLPSPQLGLCLCTSLQVMIRFGRCVSCAIEVHIALCFALASFRRQTALRLLAGALPFVWVVGLVMLIPEMFQSHSVYSFVGHHCEPQASTTLVGAMLLVCVTICLFAYGATSLRSVRSPGTLQRMVWRRASSFLFSFLFCTCLRTTQFFTKLDVLSQVGVLASVLESLSGFANMFVYAAQSSYLKHMPSSAILGTDNLSPECPPQQRAGSCGMSFHTDFARPAANEVIMVSFESSCSESAVPAAVASASQKTDSDLAEEAEVEAQFAAAQAARNVARGRARAARRQMVMEQERLAYQALQRMGF